MRLREMDRTFPLILYWFIFGFFNPLRVYGNAEVDALNALKTQLQDPNNVLQSWNITQVNPCRWSHITCNTETRVTRIDLGNAYLSGQLVPQLGQLSNLQYLHLYSNNFSGRIPDEIGNLTNLLGLELYRNRLEGAIPDTLGNLQKLCFLRLGNNSLTGTIPYSLTTIDSLQLIDLSNNFLIGTVPSNGSFSQFTDISCNFILLYQAIALVWQGCRYQQDHFTDVPAEEDPGVHLKQLIKRFSLHELQVATNNFNEKNILGRGAFGKVYKGRLADGALVAVKRLIDGVKAGELQFQMEVEMISIAVHRNLLRLQGFCMTPTERLLVYPFMVNGSVASCLRDRPLDWPTRKRIALGSARGLAYLHEHCDPKIIHHDVKAANILLDEEFEAVVGDFGLAKLMDYNDTHVTTGVRGTIGHIAPEYISTRRSSEKSDVFGYGVMLLELVIGQRAYDLGRHANDDEVMLLDWVKGLLGENKMEILVDAEGNYLQDVVEELIQIALLCTQVIPLERPKMSEVVKMLEGDGLEERWEEWQKEEIYRQEFRHMHVRNKQDSSYNPSNDHLSGPR
ncbi:unnamed protein product [Lactuca saligna]|uniref:non-specific serine/threonine protein kinase n=1 Tax=Lactuca saligna TaxID=75948 RepID=A0AA36A4D3_LACSI|nr:unnamed protein product [Lactuca saligna]